MDERGAAGRVRGFVSGAADFRNYSREGCGEDSGNDRRGHRSAESFLVGRSRVDADRERIADGLES